MPLVSSFTFGSYAVDTNKSIVTFTYRVRFRGGISITLTDRLSLPDVVPMQWQKIPRNALDSTLQALLLVFGMQYWSAFPTRDIRVESFKLSRKQADFWNLLYLNGLGEYFYTMKIDFRGLIAFPFDENLVPPTPELLESSVGTLLLNGAGKDSIVSAEMLRAAGEPFDLFTFEPTIAHTRVAEIVGVKMIRANRRHDPLLDAVVSTLYISCAYPSVSAHTFVAVLLAQLLGYRSILLSNESSADFGNLDYLGLSINHQWCKSTEAESMINDYICEFIAPNISTASLLRNMSELEIVKRFVEYPQYLPFVTSCNTYFALPRFVQPFLRTPFWCNHCPKCAFLFTCFAAYIPKRDLVKIFGADLFARRRLLPLYRRLLGVEGFKPFDCVGVPEEMVLAMSEASRRGEYAGEPIMQMFEERFFSNNEARVEAESNK